MQGKNIRNHIRRKIEQWAESVTDNDGVKSAILDSTFVTGGAIVSLLQGDEPHDYDVYFRDEKSLIEVAEYYVQRYAATAGGRYKPILQRCKWDNDKKKWVVLSDGVHDPEERVRVFIRSDGASGNGYDPHSEYDIDYKRELAQLNKDAKERKKDKPKCTPYTPVFLTNNAITLSDKIQLILRFYGEPDQVHANYDYVHCTSYWKSWDDELVLPSRALEAIINKELYYIGSKYPLCSIIRMRKFLKRGWTINAGQIVKMAIQLNELDLKNLHVFEEQLIGVDSAYFHSFLMAIDHHKDDPDFSMDSGYLIGLINDVFDDGNIVELLDTEGDSADGE